MYSSYRARTDILVLLPFPFQDLESFHDSWANLICDTLDAQCHNCAWSGYGMVENCCGGQTLASDIWKRTLATVVSPNASDFHGNDVRFPIDSA